MYLTFRVKFFAPGHNTIPMVRLEPGTSWSPVEHSTTEPLHSPLDKSFCLTRTHSFSGT